MRMILCEAQYFILLFVHHCKTDHVASSIVLNVSLQKISFFHLFFISHYINVMLADLSQHDNNKKDSFSCGDFSIQFVLLNRTMINFTQLASDITLLESL